MSFSFTWILFSFVLAMLGFLSKPSIFLFHQKFYICLSNCLHFKHRFQLEPFLKCTKVVKEKRKKSLRIFTVFFRQTSQTYWRMSPCWIYIIIMCLLTFPKMKFFSRGIVYPLDACFMKTVVKVPSWTVEIDRHLNQTIHSFIFFTSYIITIHRMKITTKNKWTMCAITSVKSSQKQTILSRCTMILVSLERSRSSAFHGDYTLIVPKPYGIKFTITTLQIRYSGV